MYKNIRTSKNKLKKKEEERKMLIIWHDKINSY